MNRASLLASLILLCAAAVTQASAQDVAPAAAVPAAEAPRGFTSGAQARAYLAQNPIGARAEQAFRATVDADLAARNPDLDPAQIASGWALTVMPGATATPDQIEAVINGATAGIGARKGLF